MAFDDPDDLDALTEGLIGFIDQEVVPLETQNRALVEDGRLVYDPVQGGYSKELLALFRKVRQASAKAGYYTMFAPENVGGAGLGSVALFRAWEQIGHVVGPGRHLPYQAVGHWTNGPSFLLGELHPSLRDEVVPDIMSGTSTVCFGMSEPDAGSDAWEMSTRARREAGGWVINGVKQWTSNSPYAKYAFIFAVTDQEMRAQRKGGISCFLVPTDTPGFQIDSVLRLFEHVGGNEAIVSLTDVKVAEEYLVGTLHHGFDLALRGVSNGRMYNAGYCVGMARWALEQAVEYADTRKTFGRKISEYQGVTFQLADCATDIYAAKSMALDCARRLDGGRASAKELAMVKVFTTEMCFQVFDRCMQVCGAMGLTNELRFVAGWHHARMVRIADGTGEVMRRNIGNRLLKGDLAF